MNKFIDFLNLKEVNVSQDIQTVDSVLLKPEANTDRDKEDAEIKDKLKIIKTSKKIREIEEDFESQSVGFIQRVMNPSTEKDTSISNPEEDFMYGYDEELLEELFNLYQNFYLLPNEELQAYTNELEDLFDLDNSEDSEDSKILNSEDNIEFSALEELIYYCVLLLEEGYNSEDIFELLDFEESDLHLSDEEVNYIFDEMYLVLDILDQEGFELDEAAGRFTSKNYNRKKRKFMKKSVSVLNREKVKRKQANRQNKAKRKQYYRQNKPKIKRYGQQYRKAVKAGKHKKKIRRRQG